MLAPDRCAEFARSCALCDPAASYGTLHSKTQLATPNGIPRTTRRETSANCRNRSRIVSSARVEKHQRHVECGPEVDDPFDLRGLLDRPICWFLAKRPTSSSTANPAGPKQLVRLAWLPYTRRHWASLLSEAPDRQAQRCGGRSPRSLVARTAGDEDKAP